MIQRTAMIPGIALLLFALLTVPASGGVATGLTWSMFYVGATILLAGAGVTLVYLLSLVRLARRARANNYLLCTECCNSLQSLAASGTCPACGESYREQDVRARWLRTCDRIPAMRGSEL